MTLHLESPPRMPTPAIGRLCLDCKHLRRDWTCEAFGRRTIPAVIWGGTSDHLAPVPGDGGVIFEPREGPLDFSEFDDLLDLVELTPQEKIAQFRENGASEEEVLELARLLGVKL